MFLCSYYEPVQAKSSAAAAADHYHHRRDVGTEMTLVGISCNTQLKSTSPVWHSTHWSGPLVPYTGDGGGMDISERSDGHLARLDLGARFDAMLVNWSSKEEEEEVSQSLRHLEAPLALELAAGQLAISAAVATAIGMTMTGLRAASGTRLTATR